MSKLPRNPLQPGQRFGKLTVIEYAGREEKYGKQLYRCQCDCGNEITVQRKCLTSGDTKSCGCLRQKPETRLQPGQRFGRLTVIEFAGRNKYRQQIYRCQCDCGNETTVYKGSLISGHTSSCGCLHESVGLLQPGQRFGRLTVIEFARRDKYGGQFYLCRCDCGNETIVRSDKLVSGHTRSCGCLFIDQTPVRFGLQDGTNVSNIKSTRPARSNTTGVRGVFWNRRRGYFMAQLQFQGKRHVQCGFKTVAEAAKCRQQMYDEIVQPYLDSLDAKEKAASRGGAAE